MFFVGTKNEAIKARIIRQHGMEFNLFADDSQIYFSFDSSSCCWSAVVSPIQASSLFIGYLLNGDKTELLIIGSHYRPSLQFPPVVLNDGSVILPSKYAKTISVTFDSVLNFERILLMFASLVILIFVIFVVLANFYLLSARRF